jgi:Heterokaryon incompatibility protein (HET)
MRSPKELSLRDLQPHPLSKSCLAIARSWIHSCLRDHDTCKRPSSTFMPKRLLAIRDERITIVDTRHLQPSPYATLSHCWGNTASMATTTRTLELFKDGIDVFDLPRTFRDGVEIARRLEQDYLWIDSLCILQDSIQDWEEESQNMGPIYQN